MKYIVKDISTERYVQGVTLSTDGNLSVTTGRDSTEIDDFTLDLLADRVDMQGYSVIEVTI